MLVTGSPPSPFAGVFTECLALKNLLLFLFQAPPPRLEETPVNLFLLGGCCVASATLSAPVSDAFPRGISGKDRFLQFKL